ncbi:hypothetical protein V2J09_021102 [Rumex salicifolius]
MDARAKKALFRAKLKEQAHKTRIDSPLVRYNEIDQPVCRVCDLVLKSESLWPAHQASKKHHEAINNLKANASRQNSVSNIKPAPVKEFPISKPAPVKELPLLKPDGLSDDAKLELSQEFQKSKESSTLPANFFDKPELKREKAGSGTPKSMNSCSSVKEGPSPVHVNQDVETSVSGVETTQAKRALPEGFFDNKEADLRARGIQIVKPDVQDEYKEFEKLIKEDLQEVDNRFEEEEIDAAEMIEEEETVEHLTYKERIEMLKRKKRELVVSRPSKPSKDSNPASKKSKFEKDESSSSDDDDDSFTVDWRAQHGLLRPVCVPTEGVVDELPLRGQQLDLRHRNVGARNGVAAGEVYGGGGGCVIRSLNVLVGDTGEVDGGGLIATCLSEAVVLVYDDAVLGVVHLDVLEGDVSNGAGSALPRLDAEPVVGVPDDGVADGDVGDARLGVLNPEAADADAVAVRACHPVYVHVHAPRSD